MTKRLGIANPRISLLLIVENMAASGTVPVRPHHAGFVAAPTIRFGLGRVKLGEDFVKETAVMVKNGVGLSGTHR